MKKEILNFMVICLITGFLGGCKGKDGDDGKLYSYLYFTSDINAIDLSEIIINEPAVYYYKYANIYWRSNSTWYVLTIKTNDTENGDDGRYNPILVVGTDGDDGRDAVYESHISGAYYSQRFLRYENSTEVTNIELPAKAGKKDPEEICTGAAVIGSLDNSPFIVIDE